MDYIDARVLLSKEKPLAPQEAVDILNSWRSDPENYYLLLKTQGASVPLLGYRYCSEEDSRYVFEKTKKRILSPAFALKFFEFRSDSMSTIFMETLDMLTFSEDDEDSDVAFYAWPYYNAVIVSHLTPVAIIHLLLNWNYVFDCEADQFGMVYNTFYETLKAAEECTDILAVNSFNLHGWGENTNHPIEDVAKHYHFANYSVALEDGSEDIHFRKTLVHYLYAYWQNMEDIITAVLHERIMRSN